MIPYYTNALNVLNADIKGTYIKYSLVPESIDVFIKNTPPLSVSVPIKKMYLSLNIFSNK